GRGDDQGVTSMVSDGAPPLSLPGVGALACAAVVLFVVVRGPPGGDRDALQMRGDGASKIGVHVRCLDVNAGTLLSEADVVAAATLACPARATLAFSATNTSKRTLYVSGIAVADSADSAALFTLPFAGEAALAIPSGAVDQALPRGFPLREVRGRVQFSARLTTSPTPGSESAGAPSLTIEVTP
ncbi:MAG TPA: hypothetical protein VGO62_17575, partial [Myxococcota bacterium]